MRGVALAPARAQRQWSSANQGIPLPASPEVRLHAGSSRGGGLIIAQQMERLGASPVKGKTLKQARADRDTYEVWLSNNLCAQGSDRPAACDR